MHKELRNADLLDIRTVQLLNELLDYEVEINDGHTVLVKK